MPKVEIPKEIPYNPLEKKNIGESIIKAMLESPKHNLPPMKFIGAGVYALYYSGDNPIYKGLNPDTPIYVGKAVPSGARKGNVGSGEDQGTALYGRLKDHADSIECANNLDINDFRCRYLSVDDIWIPLAETLLIERFHPIWNTLVDGFGNHDPGKGRYAQQRSDWDTIHEGRDWANKLKPSPKTKDSIVAGIKEALATSTK